MNQEKGSERLLPNIMPADSPFMRIALAEESHEGTDLSEERLSEPMNALKDKPNVNLK